MKKFFTIVALLLIAALSFGAVERSFEAKYESISGSEMSVKFTLDGISIKEVIKDGVTYSVMDYQGVKTNEKGYAELPKMSAALQLGDEYDVIISSVDGNYEEIALDHPLLPSRGTIYRNQDPSTIPYEIDPKSVVDAWYPENAAFAIDPYVFRDVRGVNIYAHPVQYNAAKQTIRVYNEMTVVLKEDLSKTTNPLTIKPDYVVSSMNDVYRTMFINYDESKFANQIGEFGDILVIYTSGNGGLSAIQPYIDWKRQKGFQVTATQVTTGTNVVSAVANEYSSNPNLLYVQLVGDWADIKCDLGGGDSSPMDPDIGMIVGSDLYPEVIVGRFSANSEADVTVQVDKAINYEKNPDMSGTWYKTGLGIGSPDGSGVGDDGEIDYQHIDIIKENKLLPYTYTTVNEAYSNPTATDVANFVNAGTSIINYCGHGANTYWVTSSYSNTNIASSTNGSKLPFIISVACVNGEFDVTTCFAEAWLRKSGGGAVATLMATINQPWTPPMVAQDYMNDILIGGYDYSSNPGSALYSPTADDHRTTFGSIAMNGNVLMITEDTGVDAQNTINTWTIFGDASLQVRTDTPTAITNSGTAVLPGSYDATITETTGGAPVEGALVSLYRNGVSVSGFTNSSGYVSITHPFSVGDDVTVTVSGYNLETEQSIMSIVGDTGGTFSYTPSSLSYGSVTSGSSSVLQFQISNAHGTEYLLGDITTITGYTVSVAAKDAEPVKDVRNTMNYSVAPGSYKTFDLTFSPTTAGSYNGNITITSSDTGHATEYLAVTGTGIAPDINLNPTSLSATTAPESSTNKQFDIENTDTGTLNYSMTINYTGGKEIKGSGGPDTFGYKWTDSDETNGPVYSWVDITGSGTKIGFTSYDQVETGISLGFDFNFYGNTFSTVNICTNGFLSFTSTATTYTNVSIPASAEPNNLIALCWDDFDPSRTGADGVYYYADAANSRFIVSYVDVPHYGTDVYNNVQVILYTSGKIVYQYQEVGSSTVNTCTVGIENSDASDGSLVTYNSAYLKNNFAIQFQATPEWLSVDSNTGSIVGIGSDTITATFDAAGLEVGTYTADIVIGSNDPDEGTKLLPVTFNVAYGETGGTFAVNQSSISYGNVGVSQSSVKQFTITNSHASEYLMGNITTIDGFTVATSAKEAGKNALDYTVSPSSSKTFDLTFAPLAEQAYSGNITITSTDDAHLTEYIAVSGTGTVPVFGIPFSENFNASTNLPTSWTIVDHQGNGQVWQFGTGGSLIGAEGNYAYLNSDAYGSGNTQNTDLVTPKIDMSNAADITLSFDHYFNFYSAETATLSYSIDGGTNWTQIQQWSSDTSNPESFNQAIPALDGQSNVKLKWNYTGSWGFYWSVDDILITGTITQLEAPGNIAVVTATDSEVNIGWDVVPGATTYNIYRSTTDPYSGFVLHDSTSGTTYQDTDVSSGNKYFYYITSDNAKK